MQSTKQKEQQNQIVTECPVCSDFYCDQRKPMFPNQCLHLVCSACIESLYANSAEKPCVICRVPLKKSDFKVHEIVLKVINSR